MNIKTQANKYGIIRRANHWIVALLFISLLSVGLYMTELTKTDPMRGDLYAMHKSFGVILFICVLIRIIWLKFDNKIDNSSLTKVERIGSASLHGFLYILMLVMPISGALMSMSYGHKVKVFDLFALPMLIDTNYDFGKIMSLTHEFAAYFAIVLIFVHILASVYHHFVKKDGVLKRMI